MGFGGFLWVFEKCMYTYITGTVGVIDLHTPKYCTYTKHTHTYIHSSAPVSTGNTFQDLTLLCEAVDDT
jgi:hypothetical protein